MQSVLSISEGGLGRQRLWRWRGWRVRYSFSMPPQAAKQPPIILLHGFGANLNQWRQNLVPLGQHHPVYAIDLLGFGGSEKAATLYNAELWSQQVYEFWRAIVGRPAIVLGHSLGALVALTAVSQQPAMAQGLVMITLPLSREDLVASWVADVARSTEKVTANPLLMRSLFYGIRRPSLLKRALRGIYTRPELVDQELLDTFARPPQERGAARTLCYLVRSRTQADFSPSTRDMLQGLQMPTLLLWGRQDRVVPFGWADKIAALSPHVVFKPVEGGHCCYDEFPEVVNHLVLDWLAAIHLKP